MSWSTPKFHCLLHFPRHFKNTSGKLVNCWLLERKHKVPKEFGTDIRSTQAYKRSVLHEVTCDHLYTLDLATTYEWDRLGRVTRCKPTKKVLEFLSEGYEVTKDELLQFGCGPISASAAAGQCCSVCGRRRLDALRERCPSSGGSSGRILNLMAKLYVS